MQNHQGSIHVSRVPEDQTSAVNEQLDFNKNQLADDEEMKDESVEDQSAKVSGSDKANPRQKLKFKCPICLNKQFISKCKLDWHMKCHERQFQCPHAGCTKSFK